MRQMRSACALKKTKSIFDERECGYWTDDRDKWKVETGWTGWNHLLMKQNADIEQKKETNEKKRPAEEDEVNY